MSQTPTPLNLLRHKSIPISIWDEGGKNVFIECREVNSRGNNLKWTEDYKWSLEKWKWNMSSCKLPLVFSLLQSALWFTGNPSSFFVCLFVFTMTIHNTTLIAFQALRRVYKYLLLMFIWEYWRSQILLKLVHHWPITTFVHQKGYLLLYGFWCIFVYRWMTLGNEILQ